MERITQAGGNTFMDYQLPEAVLKLRQGVGRLIIALCEQAAKAVVALGRGAGKIERRSHGPALALASHNTVIILNRRDEFSRAKEGNLKGIMRALEAGQLECIYNAGPEAVEALPANDTSGHRLRFRAKAGQSYLLAPLG